MEKTSKIAKVVKEKDRTNATGDKIYYSTVIMENGDEYPISKGKKQSGFFKEGQELTYTIEKVGEYNKIVVKDVPQQTQRSTQKEGGKEKYVSFAASYAKDVLVANPNFKMSEFGAIATEILNWMIDKHDSLNSK